MGGHGEGLQRPCGDQPETSVRRGKPQASDGPRLRGWVSFSSLDVPGVLGLRSRGGRESQAILYRSREQSPSPCPPLDITEIEGFKIRLPLLRWPLNNWRFRIEYVFVSLFLSNKEGA